MKSRSIIDFFFSTIFLFTVEPHPMLTLIRFLLIFFSSRTRGNRLALCNIDVLVPNFISFPFVVVFFHVIRFQFLANSYCEVRRAEWRSIDFQPNQWCLVRPNRRVFFVLLKAASCDSSSGGGIGYQFPIWQRGILSFEIECQF